MRKLSAVLLCIILLPCLCSCRETALPRAVKDKKPLALENYIKNDPPEEAPANDEPAAENPAESAPETLPDSEPTSAPEFSETPAASEPVFLEDIHEWADGNYLYNNNISFNRTDRFYMPFTREEQPAALWYGMENTSALDEVYDPSSAVEFAKAHWDDGLDVCAPFISRCLRAGGLSVGSDSSTSLCLMLLNSRLGFGQFLPINADTTVTLPDYASPGDVVQTYCSYEGLMIHSLMFVGNDENGLMKVCCHNSRNSGTYAFRCGSECYACGAPLREVFYYHFLSEGEELPEAVLGKDTLLMENVSCRVPDQAYDRQKALEYIESDPLDGIGQYGALRTSKALKAGGIDVSSPVQSALFMQLMKSRHGTMYSIAINPDRTVTLPDLAEAGDVCFLLCSDEAMIYSSFLIKGADKDGKMLAYSQDKINDDTKPFRVESVCPSSVCDGEIKEVILYHFD